MRELDHLLRNHKFIDLYKVIKDSLLLSTNDYRLKTIEKFYNFTHDSDVASGEDSLVAFENYLETNSEKILNVKHSIRSVLNSLSKRNEIDRLGPGKYIKKTLN